MYYSIQAIHGGNQQMSYQFEQASCGFFCKCSNILGKAEGMNACRLAWQATTPSESKFKSGFWQNISPLRSLTTLLMVSGSCQRTQILLTSLMQVWQFQSPYLWSKGDGLEMISKAVCRIQHSFDIRTFFAIYILMVPDTILVNPIFFNP